jgi:hypothetical protein
MSRAKYVCGHEKFCSRRCDSKHVFQMRHEIPVFVRQIFAQQILHLRNFTSIMLFTPEKVSLLAKVREKAFFLAFFATALLAMAGWIYWLSSIVLKIVLWCFS